MTPRPLPPERRGHAAPPALVAMRARLTAAAAAGTWKSDHPVRDDVLGGVRCRRVLAERTPALRLIHFHGGGYRLGCPETSEPYAVALARSCGIEVICPAYRLAPEHPFPAALHDALAIIDALEGDTALALGGDSAGGGLAAALAAHGVGRLLAGLVLHSPWLDLTVTSPSHHANEASDPLFSPAAAREAAALTLQGHDPRDPLASPLFADVAALPPVLLTVGSGEVLRDDARAFHAALAQAGRETTLLEVPGMDHVAVTRGPDLPGAAEAMAATQAFVDRLVPP